MSDKRVRDVCFTLNNYTEGEYDAIYTTLPSHVSYAIVGKETGHSGTPHLQGYLSFKSAKTFTAIKKLIGNRCHIEARKGTPQQAYEYCMKDNDYYEIGERPKGQGKRTDLEDIKEVIKETNKMSEVVMVAKSYQAVKMAEQILKYHEAPRTWKPRVEWYCGSTGCGKSKLAYEKLGYDCYTCLSTGRWFDGYDAHDRVLIDDMRKDFMKFHDLLRLLDRNPMRVETKGGTRQMLAKHIIITSPYHPSDLYKTREDVNQLLRRIDDIIDFDLRKRFNEVLQQLCSRPYPKIV